MDKVVATDGEAVAVAADGHYHKIGARDLEPRGHRQRPAVDTVIGIDAGVGGEAPRTTDAGNDGHVFALDVQFHQALGHGA